MKDEQIEGAIDSLGNAIQALIEALGEIDGVLNVELHPHLRKAAVSVREALELWE